MAQCDGLTGPERADVMAATLARRLPAPPRGEVAARRWTMGTATRNAPGYLPLHRVRPETLSGATAQTPGMAWAAALSGRTVGAQHLWMGKTLAPAGKVSAVHHHGEGETGIYLLRGRVTLFFGE